MLIQMVTERHIRKNNYWMWADLTIRSMNNAADKKVVSKDDFRKLLKDGELTVTSKYGNQTVTTTIKILEG